MLNTIPPLTFRLTQENRRINYVTECELYDISGAEHGRNGSAKNGGGRIAADDRRRRRGLCKQQYVADGAASGSHQRRLQLAQIARGPIGGASAGAVETGGAGAQIGHPRLLGVPGGWQKTQDVEAAPAVYLQYDPGRLPRKMGLAGRLSDGGAELC